MSREIKFRCFYKIDNTMLEVTEINFTGNAITPTCLFWSPELGLHEAPIEFERDFELMQYTGLKDKHGKEIYEGDIIKTENYFGGDDETDSANLLEVRFVFGKFIADLPGQFGDLDLTEINKTCEVVGNIYQNKDLLE